MFTRRFSSMFVYKILLMQNVDGYCVAQYIHVDSPYNQIETSYRVRFSSYDVFMRMVPQGMYRAWYVNTSDYSFYDHRIEMWKYKDRRRHKCLTELCRIRYVQIYYKQKDSVLQKEAGCPQQVIVNTPQRDGGLLGAGTSIS